MIRWRFYREHKFVLSETARIEQLIARSDFTDNTQVMEIEKNIQDLAGLMEGHAAYENYAIHALLRAKGSAIHETIEADHAAYAAVFTNFFIRLASILAFDDAEERLKAGYDFYLCYREFESDHLRHINEEERVLMPELQRLYTDDELSAVEKNGAYAEMTAEQILEMIRTLFPYLSPDDHAQFLQDIQDAHPEKFTVITSNLLLT